MPPMSFKTAAKEQYRILVADESSAMRNLFHSLPAITDIQVRAVMPDRSSLLHGIQRHTDVDAVLCADHISGHQGGVQVLQELRARNLLPHHVGFILMSADSSKANLMSSIEAQPDGLLLKPFSASALAAKLQTVVRRRRELAPLRALAAQHQWQKVIALATHLLEHGTRYPSTVNGFRLEAAARVGDQHALQAAYQQLMATSAQASVGHTAQARLALSRGEYAIAEQTLAQLIAQQPANVPAVDLMIDVLIAKEDFVGAQRQLQNLAQLAPQNATRQRLLGHVALLNLDMDTACKAYLAAMRAHRAASSVDELDAVNATRALILNEDYLQAWQVVSEARKALPDSKALALSERIVEALMYRSMEALRRSQQRIVEVIAALGQPLTADNGPLRLAVIEASLIVILVHPAHRLSKLIGETNSFKLHPLQLRWAKQLEKWATTTESNELPNGLRHFYKFF